MKPYFAGIFLMLLVACGNASRVAEIPTVGQRFELVSEQRDSDNYPLRIYRDKESGAEIVTFGSSIAKLR
jgi:hypothetical protein